MSIDRACVVAWWRRRWRRVLVIGAMVLVVSVGYGMLLARSIENDQRQDDANAAQRTETAALAADTSAKVTEVCQKINELPDKLSRALALIDERSVLLGPTTSAPLPVDLTDGERAELARINAELLAITAELGDRVDCTVGATTSTTRRNP